MSVYTRDYLWKCRIWQCWIPSFSPGDDIQIFKNVLQIYTLDFWLNMAWIDYRIGFPESAPKDFVYWDLKRKGEFWKPDVVFKNARKITMHDQIVLNQGLVFFRDATLILFTKYVSLKKKNSLRFFQNFLNLQFFSSVNIIVKIGLGFFFSMLFLFIFLSCILLNCTNTNFLIILDSSIWI